jgi:hypothetical protein
MKHTVDTFARWGRASVAEIHLSQIPRLFRVKRAPARKLAVEFHKLIILFFSNGHLSINVVCAFSPAFLSGGQEAPPCHNVTLNPVP